MNIIEITKTFVKEQLAGAEGGHDFFHIMRVYKNAMHIYEMEENPGDKTVVALGALLHDIADSKFYNGDETVGPRTAKEFLETQGVEKEIIDHVIKIIENISFKGGNYIQEFTSKELDIIQDADRLDAIGAIGVARTFNYGGHFGRELYNPEIQPNLNMTKEEYKKSKSPTLNHFYEKLLLLKNKMNTKAGEKIAEGRHKFLEIYLEQFLGEWEGKM